ISKDTSSNAAGVLQRVPGVSLVDRFVFVRGLGERYSNTSLNDAILPTAPGQFQRQHRRDACR
ncbi:MAG TPA: hypothetical protein VIG62_11495, partial [Blastocatellia bacterium]